MLSLSVNHMKLSRDKELFNRNQRVLLQAPNLTREPFIGNWTEVGRTTVSQIFAQVVR